MSYPTLEQYQEALQYPQTVFTDPQLKTGRIRTSGLGLPVVVSGGFALTYAVEVGSSKFAVRCFHRQGGHLERRYAAIHKKLKAIASPYFVDFEFQPHGAKLNGSTYPLVKMAWASGETLGEFVETNHADKTKLTNLLNSLSQLAASLEQQGIAHGDLQEGNLMVADGGKRVQLIDYDGMFVPEIAPLGSSEMGHRDYQHPQRDSTQFDGSLDRFSFMALNLALRALCEQPALWNFTGSGAGVIVFRANDFADPSSSSIFAAIAKITVLATDTKNFAAICRARYTQVPSILDFLNARSIPQEIVVLGAKPLAAQAPIGYISQYPVLDAKDYAAFANHIGQMVELVGRVVGVKHGLGQHGRGRGKPYVFVNFAAWTGLCVKITLWSDALAKGGIKPTAAWIGSWVTIKGLVEPIFRKQQYQHISITAATPSQITQLSDAQAQYRLKPRRPENPSSTSNANLLGKIKGDVAAIKQTPAAAVAKRSLSANQQVLENLRQQAPSTPRPVGRGGIASPPPTAQSPPQTPRYTQGPSPKKSRSGVPWWAWCIGLVVLYAILR